MRITSLVFSATLIASTMTAQEGGEWKLDETSGTVANDISNSGNHGTLINFAATPSPWVTGKFGNALSFDGVDDYIDIGIKRRLPIYDGYGSPYSVCFWVKAPPQNDKRIYSEGSDTSNTQIATFGTGRTTLNNTDKFQVYLRNDQNVIVCEGYSSATVFDDTWHHFAFVDVSGEITMYVDGVKDASVVTYARAPGATNFGTFTLNKASIGAVLRAGVCCFLQGLLDDVRVYDFALTAADVNLIVLGVPKIPYKASVGRYGHGCAGALNINSTGNSTLGGNMTFQLTGGTPNASGILLVGAGVTPLDLSIAGFVGCVSYADLNTSILAGIGALNGSGTSVTVPVTVPGQASLAGLIGVVQGVALSAKLELSQAILTQLGN